MLLIVKFYLGTIIYVLGSADVEECLKFVQQKFKTPPNFRVFHYSCSNALDRQLVRKLIDALFDVTLESTLQRAGLIGESDDIEPKIPVVLENLTSVGTPKYEISLPQDDDVPEPFDFPSKSPVLPTPSSFGPMRNLTSETSQYGIVPFSLGPSSIPSVPGTSQYGTIPLRDEESEPFSKRREKISDIEMKSDEEDESFELDEKKEKQEEEREEKDEKREIGKKCEVIHRYSVFGGWCERCG